jgi:hypothetical protein
MVPGRGRRSHAKFEVFRGLIVVPPSSGAALDSPRSDLDSEDGYSPL